MHVHIYVYVYICVYMHVCMHVCIQVAHHEHDFPTRLLEGRCGPWTGCLWGAARVATKQTSRLDGSPDRMDEGCVLCVWLRDR